ncbi:MAG: alpha-amylase [Planctomycetes bacterium]|nr:alpha-amylase [Planctomycetota bacterium]
MQQAYELNVRTWRSERTAELGRPANLDDLPHEFLDRLVEQGFTWLYLLGVWTTGPRSVQVSRQDQHLRHYLATVLPSFSDEDITGSPFAVQAYTVPDALGGDDALERLRSRAQSSGLSLMLDFVPNHIGLDHPWAVEHPEYCVQGDEWLLRQNPDAYVRIGGRILAHGRDPFFAPWRYTLQLDYSNDRLHEEMMKTASAVAARCDGIRCDVAMLLLPDVFANTWKRQIKPFWRACLERVRAEHPGTLFMAEVYWNREYELQQAGFDFTYDKILYDRLLASDAEAIRGHLRATADYQGHCVRFLENHEEQRASAKFADANHHRGALFLTGMVPGMLLCHCGQEEGRRLHNALHAARRPPENGSELHRGAYDELMHLLAEPARHDGAWRLLEPKGGGPLIGCLWSLAQYHSLLLIVNAGWSHYTGAIDAGPLAGRDCTLQDALVSGSQPFTIPTDQLQRGGIPVTLPPWGAQVLRISPQR